MLVLYSAFSPTTSHTYLSASAFGQAEMKDRGLSPRAPLCLAMPGCFGWHQTGRGVRVWLGQRCHRAACWAHQPSRLTQLIPLAVRDSCQTVPAFWSLPTQARFRLVSCGWPWIPHHHSCEGLSLCFLNRSLFCRVGGAGAGYS